MTNCRAIESNGRRNNLALTAIPDSSPFSERVRAPFGPSPNIAINNFTHPQSNMRATATTTLLYLFPDNSTMEGDALIKD